MTLDRRLLALVLLLARLAMAQDGNSPASLVPTDHYGPPACTGVHPAQHRLTAKDAADEQSQGALLEHAIPAAEPLENFALSRYRLADYGDCLDPKRCYWTDLDAQYKRAELALHEKIANTRQGEKLAVVLDIDETVLSDYCEMKREDFGYVPSLYSKWEVSLEASVAIPGGLRLFQEARAHNVAVFFITGRHGAPAADAAIPTRDETEATARNLEAAGYHGWTGLRLRDGDENTMATVEYKSAERKRIVKQGYTILLSVGDQWSDLLGSPQAEVSVKLPNPFYFIP